jgi:hypothetical protein
MGVTMRIVRDSYTIGSFAIFNSPAIYAIFLEHAGMQGF